MPKCEPCNIVFYSKTGLRIHNQNDPRHADKSGTLDEFN